jgi:hypothetical protein
LRYRYPPMTGSNRPTMSPRINFFTRLLLEQ